MSTTTLAFDIIAKDRASDKFDDIGDSAHKSSGKLKKFAVVGAAAAAAGALMAGKALIGMAKGAMEDQKAQTLLAATLKNTTGATDKQIASVEDWITAQGKALGVADDDLRPAMQRLAEATGSVTEAQKLSSLAMDISAGTGKSLKTVSEALAKAQMGQVGGLSRYGIATRDASGEMMNFDQVVKKASKTFEGQAATAAGTLEGKMGRLQLMFDETKETIGAKLLPIAEKLATAFLTKVVPAAQQVGQWLSEKLGPPLRELGEKAGPLAKQVVDALGGAFQDARPFIELAGKVIANVVIPALGKLLEAVGPILIGAIKGVGKVLEGIGEAGRWMWNNALQPVFRFFMTAIGTAMQKLGDLFVAMGKVPGMGWATTLGEKLQTAGEKARTLGDNITKIPSKKDVSITITETTIKRTTPGREGKGQLNTPGGYATGTNHARGGVALVGERGPELVDLPKGSVVHTASRTAAMTGIDYRRLAKEIVTAMQEGAPLVRLENAGQNAHLRGAW